MDASVPDTDAFRNRKPGKNTTKKWIPKELTSQPSIDELRSTNDRTTTEIVHTTDNEDEHQTGGLVLGQTTVVTGAPDNEDEHTTGGLVSAQAPAASPPKCVKWLVKKITSRKCSHAAIELKNRAPPRSVFVLVCYRTKTMCLFQCIPNNVFVSVLHQDLCLLCVELKLWTKTMCLF
jgi:hypothetical protein